ncbi:MAG: ATP-binding protein [Nitrospirota bacterium]|nr:ATP-binding protein [Nitrospirota bacterium]
MKRRIFRRVFILYFIVLTLAVLFMNFYLTRVIRSSYIDDQVNGLSLHTSVIAAGMPSGTVAPEFCGTISQGAGARATLIDQNGKVICDSETDPSVMDSHENRPEIRQALGSGTGWAIRSSNTLGHEFLYVARSITVNGGHAGFIRLAIPLTRVNESINALRLEINLAVILVFLTFGLILIWQTERIRKFVIQIADYAGAISHGLFKKKLYLEDAGEFTELAHDMNDMASRLEETIRTRDEETNRLGTVLKNIPDALLLINSHGTIELSNTAARELFNGETLNGRPFIEVVRSPVFLELMDEVRKGKLPRSAELVFDFPEERYLTVRVAPLYYQVGELGGFVSIFHDTTQMKKLEQMRKDFVANVSHEIRTPVTSIKGFAETLLDGALYDKENAEKFLATIKAHSERLNRLVDDLLTISKLELGVLTVSKSELHITDVIDEVIHTTVLHAAEKNLLVKKSVDRGEAMISADRDRLTQILLNLADNAIKFTEKGEIEIGIAQDGKGNYFYVKDTGAGVPQKYVARLGERFFRVDPSRSRELGGTGLGLAIVKHLVKAHNWEMKIESEEGKGTTVKVYY